MKAWCLTFQSVSFPSVFSLSHTKIMLDVGRPFFELFAQSSRHFIRLLRLSLHFFLVEFCGDLSGSF